MSTATLHYHLPEGEGKLSSAVLAFLVHGLLLVLLFFGVRWQTQAPAAIQAELWSSLPQVAAPAPEPQPVVENPAPKVEPKIEPEPPVVKPDIALKVEKPKKPVKPEVKPEVKPPPKVEPKPEVRPPAKPSQSVADLLAQAGAGNDRQTSAPRGDAGYAGLIRAKILSNIRFPLPPDLVGNPEAKFEIEQLPSGEIVSIKKIQSSGLPAFDAAVERAIQASSPLPKDKSGQVVRKLNLDFTPLEKN